jgi:hypothetical protein
VRCPHALLLGFGPISAVQHGIGNFLGRCLGAATAFWRELKACRGDRTSGEVDFPNVPAATRVILAVYHVLASRFALNNEEAEPPC